MSRDEEFAKHNPKRVLTVTIDINDKKTVHAHTNFDETVNLTDIFIAVIELGYAYKKQLELLDDLFKESPKQHAIFKAMQLLREMNGTEVTQDGE